MREAGKLHKREGHERAESGERGAESGERRAGFALRSLSGGGWLFFGIRSLT